MLEIYTIYGGGMWKTALDAVVTLVGQNTFHTLMRIAGTFGVLAVLLTFIKQRNPMVFVQWLAVFMILTSILLVPKRSVQVIDLSDPGAVWVTDNVPVGLAAIASLTTSIGYKMASVYDMLMARPDSVTYSKTGMLFGSQIVAETSDFSTQNPELAQMLPDYVENCVIGDILLNGKYTINQLLNSTDPLTLITSNPSPLRGIFKMTSTSRQFLTCQQAATEIQKLANTDVNPGSATFTWLTRKVFGNKLNGAALLANAMGESYGYFYAGGMTAAQIMKNNITNSAVRQGIKGFAARSSDTANLLNLATENAATKQRLAWAAGNELATRTLPFAQSLLMLILVCLFPLMIALAASNHTLFGLNTLKIYVSGFIYFQMWPVMFAILNYAANYWLQSQSGGTPLVLANKDVVALQHSDVANLAGYLSLSIPVLSFYLTKGAAAMGSQVAGSVLSSGAFTSAGVAATTADGNWSFNNMSMDNVSQNKMDTNLMQRQGQQTWQADNGSTQTQTAGGHTVIDGSGAMSNLPVNMKLSQLASSGFQESARQSQVQAQTALDGYNHSVTSGWSQLSQLSNQTGTSDSLTRGSENSQVTNATRGASMMMSAAESYAKANNISTQEAYNQLMSKSQEGSFNAGGKIYAKADSGDSAIGKIGKWTVGASGGIEGHMGVEYKGSDGSSHGTQDTNSLAQDMRHDKNSQAVNDFRQGMDMVKSSRITDGANHSENAASSNVQQLAATLNDAESQYHQYTTSSTQSSEFSRMATIAQNQSASLDTNYTQEFVDWAANKYGDKAQSMLTSAPSAREAAMEFVNERLKPEIMGDYQQGRSDLTSGQEHAAFSGEHIVQPARGSQQVSGSSGHDAGVSYSSQDGGTHRSGGVGSAQTYGTTQGAEYVGQQGGNYSARTDDSVSPGMEQSTVHQGQAAGQRSSSGNITSSAGMVVAGGRITADERTGHIAESHPEFHHSGAVREQGSMHGQESEVTHSRSGINVGGEKVRGDAMQESYRENQAKLQEHSSQGFGPQNELQRRVAEQRSENEHKINESAEGIGKKQSTVQVSSDILSGEHANAQSKFAKGYESEKGRQNFIPEEASDADVKARLAEIRRKAG
ncbi:conjugal transfer mating-pair stabilization protein TraG (plasmid) [Enterobacter hormaechei]|uniref:conjugal transfer mating-pair stabilization protein TraG n=1 Tax=Enterobacter hormaechei TaxID=158836 RepID=UPI0038D0189F